MIKKGISALGNTAAYGTLKTGVKRSLSPLKHGDEIIQSIHETKSAVKKAVWNEGVFRELNMDYYGPFAGNDSEKITLALDQALLQNHPVLLHFLCEERTLPAKYKELLRSSYTEPFDLQTGKKKLEETDTFRRSSSFAIEAIAQVLKKDPSVCFYSDRSSDRFLSLSAAVPKQYLSYDLSKKDLLELSIGSAAENDGVILSMDETEFLSLTDLLDTLSDQIRGRFLLCVSCKENSDLSHATVLKNYDVFLAKDSAEIADRIIRFAEQRKPQILIYPEMYLYAQEQNTIDQNDRGICPVYVNNDMRGTALITDGTDTDRIRKRITENSMNLDLYRICYLSPFDEKGLLEILNSYSRVFVYHSCIERRIRDLFNRYCSGTVVQYLGKDETDLLAEDQRK